MGSDGTGTRTGRTAARSARDAAPGVADAMPRTGRHRPRHVAGRARGRDRVPHPALGGYLARAQRLRAHACVHRGRDHLRRIGVAAADGGVDRVAEPRRSAGRGRSRCCSPRASAAWCTAIAGWMAMRYFEHTRMKATRRQLARLGIGELARDGADGGFRQERRGRRRTSGRSHRRRAGQEGPGCRRHAAMSNPAHTILPS